VLRDLLGVQYAVQYSNVSWMSPSVAVIRDVKIVLEHFPQLVLPVIQCVEPWLNITCLVRTIMLTLKPCRYLSRHLCQIYYWPVRSNTDIFVSLSSILEAQTGSSTTVHTKNTCKMVHFGCFVDLLYTQKLGSSQNKYMGLTNHTK